MALSKQSLRGNPACPLGFVGVPSIGTPVPLSVNIDANNINAPGTVNQGPFPAAGSEFTPVFRGFILSGFHPGNGNNGMVSNTGNVYLLAAAAGGAGNRSDSGSIMTVITPGTTQFWPPMNPGMDFFSPYYYYLDADANNEGCLVTALGGGNP